MTPALSLHGISKTFGSVNALQDVHLELQPGTIHALLGENGAGKSTLVKVAFGLLRPEAGAISVDGTPRQFSSPVAARQAGIGMVHQHFTSIPAMTVWENVALAAGWAVNRPGAIKARVGTLAQSIGFDIDPASRVDELSAGVKQRVEVLKALAADARILLLDEPSSVLSPTDAARFLEQIRSFKGRGISTVLITHKFSEALTLADQVTVLRRGRVVHQGPIGATNAEELSRQILGENPPAPPPRMKATTGAIRVDAKDVVVARLGSGGTGLRRATFTARAGEVIGIAAVEGNGQRELLRAIAGLGAISGGRLMVHGNAALIPEDRTSEGLIGDFSLTENLVLSQGRDGPWVHGPWVDWPMARARVTQLIQQFGIRASGSEALAQGLSGGNQQRMVIATALERRPAVLVAENPTRGLDFRATSEVLAHLRAAAAKGMAVLVYLADLDDLMLVADRIVVLASGTAHEMPPDATRVDIGRQMLDGPG